MNISRFKGCGTALITPFRDGAVDYEAFAALVDRQVAGGVDFLVPLGTTGETPCLLIIFQQSMPATGIEPVREVSPAGF